jgi:Protein of unknown function (DUF1217)
VCGAAKPPVSFVQAFRAMLFNRLWRKGKSVLSASVSYRIISENLDRTLKTTAERPQIARETKYYLANISKVKSIDDFLGNDRLYNYAMKASGLSDMSYAKAFMRKVLKEGIDSDRAFANTLSDPRYKKFAETFNFARYGETATVFERAQQGTVDNYIRQTLEEDTGDQNEGARLALYFDRKAPEITSIYQLLGDRALLKVIHTAFQIPELTSLMDIDKQAEMIGKKLDIDDLKDPEKLKKLLNRFTSLWELDNGASSSGASGTAALFSQSSVGISSSVLSAIQNLKLGGR